MTRSLRSLTLALSVAGLVASGCKKGDDTPGLPMDTIRAGKGGSLVQSTDSGKDTAKVAKVDSAHKPSDLPPMAKAVEPDRLAQFLPKMEGWSPSGELQKEIQVRDNFNKTRVAQTYTNAGKKVTVELNDYAYIPYLYDPWTKFKGTYLDEDNVERTETTTIKGYHAVQSMEKKDPHGSITVFPGKRYIVTVTEDGTSDPNDIRHILESMDLSGLESLQ